MIKAKFLGTGGWDNEVSNAIKKGLVIGDWYEFDGIDIGGWQSSVYLKGFEKPFNSIMFNYINEHNEEIDIVDEYLDEYDEYRNY